MTVFLCVNCRQPLTGDVQQGTPQRGPERPLDHEVVSSRMARGRYSPNFDGSLLIFHPDDVPNMVSHPDRHRLSGCCGPAGQDGPNLVCTGCGAEVATKEADCWTDNLVAVITSAVMEQL
ncbi:hypothetical protein PV343_11270 [Streptomyces sp. WI03-4A]|uniref:hypothetical protein n=1 Tax=Streptomyces sp. WI03-4A TaxID=3028706 RepID=UPI0029A93400|nr:hypothetical protein [Streptomyces sp. WI03-4A]MDX2592833.1 hypothetical protein [Streptomyces sp. WI03-4A]